MKTQIIAAALAVTLSTTPALAGEHAAHSTGCCVGHVTTFQNVGWHGYGGYYRGGGIGPRAAVALGLGSFALDSAIATGAWGYHPWGGYYAAPAYYPPQPQVYYPPTGGRECSWYGQSWQWC